MKLRHAPTSPFVRKVMVAAHELGVADHLTLIPTNVWDPATDIGQDNPVGKVPALTLDNGEILFDSTVISEYLDSLSEAADLFPEAPARWRALTLNSLGDGMVEAGIRRLLEQRQGGDSPRKPWIDRQNMVFNRCIKALISEPTALTGPVTIGDISIACAISWMEFRFDDLTWRTDAPSVADLYDAFCERPSMKATVLHEPG